MGGRDCGLASFVDIGCETARSALKNLVQRGFLAVGETRVVTGGRLEPFLHLSDSVDYVLFRTDPKGVSEEPFHLDRTATLVLYPLTVEPPERDPGGWESEIVRRAWHRDVDASVSREILRNLLQRGLLVAVRQRPTTEEKEEPFLRLADSVRQGLSQLRPTGVPE